MSEAFAALLTRVAEEKRAIARSTRGIYTLPDEPRTTQLTARSARYGLLQDEVLAVLGDRPEFHERDATALRGEALAVCLYGALWRALLRVSPSALPVEHITAMDPEACRKWAQGRRYVRGWFFVVEGYLGPDWADQLIFNTGGLFDLSSVPCQVEPFNGFSVLVSCRG